MHTPTDVAAKGGLSDRRNLLTIQTTISPGRRYVAELVICVGSELCPADLTLRAIRSPQVSEMHITKACGAHQTKVKSFGQKKSITHLQQSVTLWMTPVAARGPAADASDCQQDCRAHPRRAISTAMLLRRSSRSCRSLP